MNLTRYPNNELNIDQEALLRKAFGMAEKGRNRAINPAEQSVDLAQREQAMRFIQNMTKGTQYTPVLKMLKVIGIEPQKRMVDATECFVIPVIELMEKEWKHMSEQEDV